MPVPILTTKLHMPILRPGRVHRPGLIGRMSAGLLAETGFTRSLTYVSAPAGYGKTTLVIDWLKSNPALKDAVAWLALDPNDNDPARFLSALVAALQVIQPAFGSDTLGLIQSPQGPPEEALLATLVNEIATLPDAAILVLDDYHEIQDPAIHRQVSFLLDHQPANLHLVLVTREDPLLPLSRLRARGLMLEIRGDDLRFNLEECRDFLEEVMGVSLNPDELEALARRTEGWIAGLQLAAISLQGHCDPAGFVAAFTGSSRFILDYLVDEVYQRQPQAVRDFLLKTAILDTLCGPLCDAVAEINTSQEILEKLEGANLFIISLDQSRTWYRYHRLFAELLRHRLRTRPQINPADLHIRASQWFGANGHPAQAVDHAIAAGDWERARALLDQLNTDMLKRGQVRTLNRWYRAFPESYLGANPKLCFDYAWPLLLMGQFQAAAPLLEAAEKAAAGVPTFLGEVMAAQAYLARGLGDHPRMMERSERALALLPETALESRCLVAINLGLAYWHMGQMDAAEKALDEAFESGRLTGNTYALVTALIFKGRVAVVRGWLREGADFAREAIAQGGEMPINALAHLDLSVLHYEWNHLAESEEQLQSAFKLSRRGRNDEFLIACWMMSARIKQAQGDLGASRQALSQAHDLVQTGGIPPGTTARVAAAQVRLSLKEGDLEATRRWGAQLNDHADCHNFLRFMGLTRVRLLYAQNELKALREYLDQLYNTAQGEGWGYGLIAVRIWQTLAVEDPKAAAESLAEALRRAAPAGITRSFVDVGDDLIPALRQAAQRGIEPETVNRILAAMQVEAGPRETPDQSALVEALSPRELEVLQLVAEGLSNRQIAAQLVISPGTAKTHVHNICGKLGVNNRTQAAAKAKDLGLV